MTSYETYVFLLCLIVFILLTTLSSVCVYIISKLTIRLIRAGAEDERIIEEHKKTAAKKNRKLVKIVDIAVTAVLCTVLFVAFIFSVVISRSSAKPTGSLPTYRVVNTGSMAEKHPDNKYLYQNNINNQIQTFDLIATYKLPPEDELKLYDIVVYEMDDILVVHRIIEIEEPNEAHPNERHFRLQGDASEAPDRFPVRYEQMRAIYRGDRTPFVGSFILFLQSPAGWMCIILVVFAIIATPWLNGKLSKERRDRYLLISGDNTEGE